MNSRSSAAKFLLTDGFEIDETIFSELIGGGGGGGGGVDVNYLTFDIETVRWLFKFFTTSSTNDTEDALSDIEMVMIIEAMDYFGLNEGCVGYNKYCNHFNYNRQVESSLLTSLYEKPLHIIKPFLLSIGCCIVTDKQMKLGGSWLNLPLIDAFLKNRSQFETMSIHLVDGSVDLDLVHSILLNQKHLKSLSISWSFTDDERRESLRTKGMKLLNSAISLVKNTSTHFGHELVSLTLTGPGSFSIYNLILKHLSPAAPLSYIFTGSEYTEERFFKPKFKLLKRYAKTLKHVFVWDEYPYLFDSEVCDMLQWMEDSLKDSHLETLSLSHLPMIDGLKVDNLRYLFVGPGPAWLTTPYSEYLEYGYGEYKNLDTYLSNGHDSEVEFFKYQLVQGQKQFIELRIGDEEMEILEEFLPNNKQMALKRFEVSSSFKNPKIEKTMLTLIETNQLEHFNVDIYGEFPLNFTNLWRCLHLYQAHHLKKLHLDLSNIELSVIEHEQLFSTMESMQYLEDIELNFGKKKDFSKCDLGKMIMKHLKELTTNLSRVTKFTCGSNIKFDINDPVVVDGLKMFKDWRHLEYLNFFVYYRHPQQDNIWIQLVNNFIPHHHQIIPKFTIEDHINQNIPNIEFNKISYNNDNTFYVTIKFVLTP
jgi:hypothetical protein